MLALVALSFASCDKETEGVTGITIYPVLELEGESTLIVDKGTPFEEPGYTATLDGEDVSDQVVVNSDVDTNTSGIYSVSYTITNSDGFSKNASRTVVVLDPSDDVEGVYTVDAESYRNYKGTITNYGASFDILVINKGDYYYVDDLMGGWYCQRAGYGSKYAMEGYIAIADDGSIELLDSSVAGWGDSADDFEGTYDFATHTFDIVTYYASVIEFHFTMTKN